MREVCSLPDRSRSANLAIKAAAKAWTNFLVQEKPPRCSWEDWKTCSYKTIFAE